jgi:hypothetical protein
MKKIVQVMTPNNKEHLHVFILLLYALQIYFIQNKTYY